MSAVGCEFELLADLVTGLTNRETRRPVGQTLRVSKFTYRSTLDGANLRRLEDSLRDYQIEPVVVPLWPAAVLWSDRASMPITGGLKVAWKTDWSQWAIYTTVEPGWATDSDNVAPALMGRLDKREAIWIQGDIGTFKVDFVEQSPADYALSATAQTWDNGPKPSAGWGIYPALFPLMVAFESPRGGHLISVQRQTIGFSREPLEYAYPQTVANDRSVNQPTVTSDEVGVLLRWFLDHGAGKAFWFPTWTDSVRLTAPIASDTFAVEDTNEVRAADFLAFITDGIAATGQINSVTSDTVTMVADPGAFGMDTVVSRMLLVRFEKLRLRIDWDEPGLASASFTVVELPPEYTPAADETLGSTLGLLSTRCYLYELSRTLDGTVFTDYSTSFESALTYGGNSYLSDRITHGSIKAGLMLDRDDVTITAGLDVDSPLFALATMRMEAPLAIVIRSADVSGSTAINTAVLFTGEIISSKLKGQIVTAKAVSGGTIFDRKVPRFQFQRQCNHSLFDVGCSLAKADWKWTGTVQDPGAPGYPFEIIVESISGPVTASANLFAGGWVEFGTGATWQRRAVLISTAESGAVLTLTVDRDPYPALTIGDAVSIYVGCDGSAATCQTKFDNYLNFGGHPFLPMSNPSIVRPTTGSAGGKK